MEAYKFAAAALAWAFLASLAACEQGETTPRGGGGKAKQTTPTSGNVTENTKPDKPNKPTKPGKDDQDADLGDEGDEPAGDGDEGGGQEPVAAKRITVPGSRGDQVPGYLWVPKGKSGQKHPAVLLMYGIKGNKDDGSIHKAAETLVANGYVAITIDWPGTGDRGNIGNQERITNGDVREWTVGDYQATYNYLQNLPEVDSSRIGYVGASMGAMTGLSFAARDPRVKAIAAIVPIPNPLWGGENPSTTIKRVSPRPVLCISTNDNSDFSAMVCDNVAAGGSKKALPGGHELEGFRDQVVTETMGFLDQHLKR